MKGIAPLMVIGILVLAGAFVYGSGLMGTLTGFTTLSLSQADYSMSSCTPENFFCGKLWTLTVAQGGMGQKAIGTIAAADIEVKSGTKPDRNLAIEITYSEQSCEYPIQKSSDPQILQYFTHGYPETPGIGCTQPEAEKVCRSTGFSSMVFYGKLAPYSGTIEGQPCFCVLAESRTGAIGYLDNPGVRTVADIEVSNGDAVDTARMDTQGSSRGGIGSNVYYTWNGDLIKDSCASQSPYYAFYRNGEWRIGSNTNLLLYRASAGDIGNDLSGICRVGLGLPPDSCTSTAINNLVNSNNQKSNAALVEQYFGDRVSPTSILGAAVKRDLPSFVQIPVYTFYVKADWLGIYQPDPDIRITGAVSQKFKTNGEVIVTLFNYGETANAEVWVECPLPFKMIGNNKQVTVWQGSQETVNIPVNVDTDQPVEKVCTAKSNDGFHTSEFSVILKADPEAQCTPFRKSCEYQRIVQCNQYGSGTSVIKECASNEVCKYDAYGEPGCFAEGEEPPDDWVSMIMRQLGLLFAGLVVSGVIIVILLIIGFAVAPLRMIFTFLTRDMRMLAIIWFGFGLLLMVAFAPFVGQVYVAYLANIV